MEDQEQEQSETQLDLPEAAGVAWMDIYKVFELDQTDARGNKIRKVARMSITQRSSIDSHDAATKLIETVRRLRLEGWQPYS